MMKRLIAVLLALAVLLPSHDAAAQALEADGAAALGVALRKLGTTKRVLMIAAHPDDENTALIAELALGEGADVAYLSLTRGEGGQNLIGPELQEGLGLIRSGELMSARRLDGARQFFTRAVDYGFSKSADEAFTQWPRDSLLADVMHVVRSYQPDVIVSVFSGTPADGHGQHQAAGVLARAAFEAAGPAGPAYLFQAMYRPPADPRLRISTGALDPLFGRSRYQIAMQSRSRHRSQDMGGAEPVGPQATAVELLAGDLPADAQSMFAALDTTLSQMAVSAGANDNVVAALTGYEQMAARARAEYNPLQPVRILPHLIDNLLTLDRLNVPQAPTYDRLHFALQTERADAMNAAYLASGVIVDVVSDSNLLVPGQSFELTVTVWNGGTADPRLIDVRPLLPTGWTHVESTAATGPVRLAPDDVVRRQFTVHVPDDAAPSEPYFLRAPRRGALYSWPADDSIRTRPFEPTPVRATVELEYAARIRVDRAAEHVTVDKAFGELRRPLLVVPRAAVAMEPRTLVVPTGDVSPRTVSVTVSTAADSGISGTLHLDTPAGWTADRAAVPMQLARAGDARTVDFTLTPPADATGQLEIRAQFDTGARSFSRGYDIVDYPHIDPRPLFADASTRVSAFDVDIAPDLEIGYIEGAGDDGALALRQMGAAVTQLDAQSLANEDLSRFDAIVTGIRAWEVRPDVIAHNDRLLAYARAGGTLVVQYNKYELVDGGFMPYPATMARPHGRVTDENAPVTLLEPDHPALTWPNAIAPADFDGWLHERGLYFLDSFDERYTPLLAMADAGEQALDGALVTARVGDGWYVYSGVAFFRQLPEGVPGAYRLLANLVSLGHR